MHDQNHASFYGSGFRLLGGAVSGPGHRIFRNSGPRGPRGRILEIQDRWFWGPKGPTTCSFQLKTWVFDRGSGVFRQKVPFRDFLPTGVEKF